MSNYVVNRDTRAFIIIEADSATEAKEVAKQISEEYWEFSHVEWDAYPTHMNVTPGLELE